jgi:hypothetical protein
MHHVNDIWTRCFDGDSRLWYVDFNALNMTLGHVDSMFEYGHLDLGTTQAYPFCEL